MSKHDCNTIRELGYKGCIPYYILFDPDLTSQHLKLYSLVEQMESNPNPKVSPTFSYEWFASILGIKVRGAMKIGKVMKDKGYVVHTQKPDGYWLWGTGKKTIIDDSKNQGVPSEGGVSSQDMGGVPQEDMGGVHSQDTLNTKKNNYQEEETTTLVSSSFIFSIAIDQNLVDQKLSRDKRTDQEFLDECLIHVENHSNKKYPPLQRANALVKLLKKLNADDVIFRPSKDEDRPSTKEKVAPLFSDEDLQLMQEALHAKKMAAMGQDINIFIKPEKLKQAEELLARAKAMEAKPCQPSPKNNARAGSLNSVSSLVSRLTLSQQGS